MSWPTLGLIALCALGMVSATAQILRWGYVPQAFDEEQANQVQAGWFLLAVWGSAAVSTLYFL